MPNLKTMLCPDCHGIVRIHEELGNWQVCFRCDRWLGLWELDTITPVQADTKNAENPDPNSRL